MAAYLDAVYSQQILTTDLHEGLFTAYFERLKTHLEAGWGKRFSQAKTAQEWAFMQRLEKSARDFAAFKQATITSELRALLQGKDAKKDRATWNKEAMQVMKRHNGLYLRAELDTATQAAGAAESWQEFERRKYLYPNLRYETAGDERVRESHKSLDGIVRSVDDPFWDVYYPPNGWRCRCKVIQTDEAVTGSEPVGFDPPKGFRGNVGKTGKVFGDDHPYFNFSGLDKERITENAQRIHAKITRDEVRDWARENDFVLTLPEVSGQIAMTGREAKNVTGSPHANQASRNSLLYVLATLADQLVYLGKATDTGTTPGATWYYYKLSAGLDYFLNIRSWTTDEGEKRIGLYAITDHPPIGGP